MNDQEALAGVRILCAVAQADGTIQPAERQLLADALNDFGTRLPPGETIDSILSEPVDVAVEAAKLTSPLAKDVIFEAAVMMSTVDHTTGEAEQKVISLLRTVLNRGGEPSRLGSLLTHSVLNGVASGGPIQDPILRAEQVDQIIASNSFIAGLFGFMPIPFFGELIVVFRQFRVVDEVSLAWGHPLNRKEAWAEFGAIFSLVFASVAVQSLFKFVPIWGSVASGAIAYGSTWALGRSVDYFFQNEGKVSSEDLKSFFLHAKSEGKAAYAAQKDSVEAGAKEHKAELEALTRDFSEGKISADEYDRKLDALLHTKDVKPNV